MSIKLLFIWMALSVLISNDLFGYNFTTDFKAGSYWSNFPIKMSKFVTDPSEGTLLEKLVKEAEQEWEDSIGREIWNLNTPVIVGPVNTNNYIKWSYNFAEDTGYNPASTLAVTIRYSDGNNFSKVLILLNGELDYLKQNWNGVLKQTLIHELGHTIGLDHSDDQSSIMKATLGSVHSLSNDDITGMEAIINETLSRQISIVSKTGLKKDEKSNSLINSGTCGTLSYVSNNLMKDNFLVETYMFIFSIFLGLVFSIIINKLFKKLAFSLHSKLSDI